MRETILVKQIMSYLNYRPDVRAWRNNTGALRSSNDQFIRFGLKGSADILGIVSPSGTFLAIEAKVGRNKLTPAQKAFGEMIHGMGGCYIVAYTLQDVVENLP